MTERPILFSGPMVRAILGGRKTQTRRVVKPAPDWEQPEPLCSTTVEGWQGPIDRSMWSESADPEMDVRRSPYGGPGDGLWVKESGLHKRGPLFELFIHDATPDQYWASPDHRGEKLTVEARGKPGAGIGPAIARDNHKAMGFKARPSIHMPRWASRLILDVADVRVERLHSISEDDAEAEGVQEPSLVPTLGAFWSSRDGFAKLWSHINGRESWDANPWVWVVTFEPHEIS